MPCGCTANQSGGLPRRGTFVKRARADHAVVLVDAGGAPGGTSPYERLKFEAILAGERAMGIAAHNLGAPEAALGAEYLRAIAKKLDVPFLSTNLRDAAGALVAAPSLVVEVPGSAMRIMFTGVVSPRLVAGGLKADEPRDAILKAIARHPPHDALVVLAYLPEPELRQLAAELPEADVVVGGPTGQSIAPIRVGPTWLASATNKGKFLIELETAERGTPWSGQVVELSPDVTRRSRPEAQSRPVSRRAGPARLPGGADRARRAAAGQLSRRISRRRHAGLPSLPPRRLRFVGSNSKHALAWQTLQNRGLQVDPQCQTCHTTGYGLPGGFRVDCA